VTSNRERILDTAIHLLGTSGLRALTHARIDASAGVPKGSTSNYFRTRAALLEGVVEWMVQVEYSTVLTAYAPDSVEDLADALCRLYDFMTGPNRVITTARLVLLAEASHDATVRDALARGRERMEASVVPALVRLGAPDPKTAFEAISACFEGLFLQRLARHADIDSAAILHTVVSAFVAMPSRRPSSRTARLPAAAV
jgi:AcrR family transcriptional regulator